MTEPTVMGIDAGLQGMGVVIARGRTIVYAGTSRTQKSGKKGLRVADDDADRCQQHARFLLGVVQEWKPQGAVVELPSGGAQGARANRSMGLATGVVAAALEAAGLPAEWVTPGAVKKAATGRKDASKDEVEQAVRRAFNWQAQPPRTKAEAEHVFDAAGALLAAENGTLLRALRQVRGA
ncbi:crossover junction endodeoxyribonuclease RuvC [Symbiobacterium terraclitae]|uniref:crossover junction endodeoxyribonuclease RuvC n=1 Tax=Symbiobacterium terraclitae TaxID=557451 RepID=UPI0035B515D7